MKRFAVICVLLALACCSATAQTIKGLEMHSYIESRFYANPDNSAAFGIERVSLSATADLPEKAKMYIEYYIHPWVTDKVIADSFTAEQSRNYLESAYVEIPTKDGALRVGKGRGLTFGITPFYGNRKTTQYGSVAETFTQDRITGVQYTMKVDKLEGGASIYAAPHVGSRGLGSYVVAGRTVKHVAERDDSANLSGKLAVAGKIGWAYDDFKWHLSGSTSKMIPAEADKVATFYGPLSEGYSRDTTMNKYGLDATYKKNAFFMQAEAYRGNYSIMRIDGLGLIVGYEPTDKPRVYAAYNVLTNNLAPTSIQETWDTRQMILGYVYPISKGIWLEANYLKNQETPGGDAGKVNNDLFFIELFTSI